MIDGHLMSVKYQRSQHIELVHLLRMNVHQINMIGQSFSKSPKKVNVDDIWKIPEIDKELKKQRLRDQEQWEQKAEIALNKYRNLGR